jgi:excisionase family DNA binding protein
MSARTFSRAVIHDGDTLTPQGDKETPDLLTIEEAAAITRSSYGVIYRGIRSGRLPFGKSGRRIVMTRSAVLRWVMEPQRARSLSMASEGKAEVTHG